jgi:hypothetical protein
MATVNGGKWLVTDDGEEPAVIEGKKRAASDYEPSSGEVP